MAKEKRIKKKKAKSLDIPPENINPKDFETRFGALVPWGGGGPGGFDEPQVGEDENERDD